MRKNIKLQVMLPTEQNVFVDFIPSRAHLLQVEILNAARPQEHQIDANDPEYQTTFLPKNTKYRFVKEGGCYGQIMDA